MKKCKIQLSQKTHAFCVVRKVARWLVFYC